LVSGAVMGVLHVGTLSPRRFSGEDSGLLQLVADRVALAVHARVSRVERTAATVLQRSLLPAKLPDVAGFEFAARYIRGGDGEVGGDWYDVFGLPSGSLGIVVGDVVGRGLAAAVAMGRLRSALRAYAVDCHDPAELLGKLDRQVRQFEPEVMAIVRARSWIPPVSNCACPRPDIRRRWCRRRPRCPPRFSSYRSISRWESTPRAHGTPA
jgi:hypothetical protein